MVSANVSNELRKKVYRRDGFRCALCDDTRGIQVHHVVHRSKGGADVPHNLITLCWKCHAVAHGTRLPEYPDYMGTAELCQACVEYLADLYADEGVLWNPWTADELRLWDTDGESMMKAAEMGIKMGGLLESL